MGVYIGQTMSVVNRSRLLGAEQLFLKPFFSLSENLCSKAPSYCINRVGSVLRTHPAVETCAGPNPDSFPKDHPIMEGWFRSLPTIRLVRSSMAWWYLGSRARERNRAWDSQFASSTT